MADEKKKRPRRRVERSETRSVGFGFVGKWADGTLGWCLPEHVASGGPGYIEPLNPSAAKWAGSRGEGFLCRITVELITDARGRPIKRKAAKS